ncbi:hypothetical protein OTERR_12940 [Oryzomicrobium terrae]|uniref:Portal protein n=2 Tax=Oryzomicrobium terrae TaxID=1735038 RepID=A0A5C1E777_9RHOO|nr:hypothetical protein OTERR_12940 [Oryzomicrobium terrae]
MDDIYTIPSGDQALSQVEYMEIHKEIEQQPTWRRVADKEMDYADGNQLDSELLLKQKELGIPPAVEDLIGPALLSIQGYEATIRTDWRVTPNGQPGGQDVADALNFKLNQAERESKADSACSKAFRGQIGCGIGWVEVSKESDPFNYPYRCLAIHRNEIHWDMKAKKADLSDARWLRRQLWLTKERIALTFPEHAEMVMMCGTHGPLWWADRTLSIDGGVSTGLQNAWNDFRAWTMQEDRWFNPYTKELCVAEVWYRRWVRVPIIRTPDGRVVEFDENNMAHNVAVASGMARVEHATVTRVRRSYWLGPTMLHDGPTPYSHRHFPYVPFFGFREDNTAVPYGYVRGMKYAQDSLNSGNSKLRWGMSVSRVERTKGAVDMTDAQLRRQVARPDADIVLNAEAMAKPGARFEVKRDYQLTDQHYQMLNDNRATIERVSNITSGFMGRKGNAASGVQEQTQVEQSNQSLAHIMDHFRQARTQVGELLLAMIVADMGTERHEIVIEGDAVTADRTVVINGPEKDPETGIAYLSNDLQRTRLKVALDDVPSTNSYRGQQLNAMSEAVKSMPQQYQAAILPFLVSLMDVPFKRDVVEAIRKVDQQQTPEQIKQQIDQAVQEALAKAGNDIKLRELELKERRADSEIRGLDAKAVQIGVQAAYSAMQAGAQIAQMPMIAPVADAVMQGAGYQRPAGGQDPNFPVASQTAAMNIKSPYLQGQDPAAEEAAEAGAQVRENTHPAYPPVPRDSATGERGIETARTSDNLPTEAPQ